jgi:hypothetical protein
LDNFAITRDYQAADLERLDRGRGRIYSESPAFSPVVITKFLG